MDSVDEDNISIYCKNFTMARNSHDHALYNASLPDLTFFAIIGYHGQQLTLIFPIKVTAPIATSLASVSRIKDFSKSGSYNKGA